MVKLTVFRLANYSDKVVYFPLLYLNHLLKYILRKDTFEEIECALKTGEEISIVVGSIYKGVTSPLQWFFSAMALSLWNTISSLQWDLQFSFHPSRNPAKFGSVNKPANSREWWLHISTSSVLP